MEKVSLSWDWDNYGLSVKEGFRELLNHRNLADVTLLSGDCQKIEAHRVILSIGSPFFEQVLRASPQAHPCLYLKGVDHEDLVSAIQFMYGGEVEMTQDRLHKFIGVSQDLQIKGFTEVSHCQDTSPADGGSFDVDGDQKSPADDHDVIGEEPGEIMDSEHDSAIDVDNSMLENDEAEELAEDIVNEIVAAMVEEIVEVMVDISTDESLGEEQKTIDEVISDKLIKDNANSFRCKECKFTHKRRDVTRDHIEEHHLNTGGVECQVCHKVYKTREKLRRHMYTHQKSVSRASLCPSDVNF